MNNIPSINTPFSTQELASELQNAANTSIANQSGHHRPEQTGGAPRMGGSANALAGQLRDMAAQNNILRNITGTNFELGEKNFDLLKKRLGDGFEKIMTSPGVANMVKDVKLENNFSIQLAQNSALTHRIAEASAVALPANVKRGEFGVAPLDIMPYRNREHPGFSATLLEMNGTGYGNITTMEPHMLEEAMAAMADVAGELDKNPNALFIVSCSGREDPPNFGASKKIHEKLMIANAMDSAIRAHQRPGLLAEAMSEDGGASNPRPIGAQIIGLDTFDSDALVRDAAGKLILEENGEAKQKPGRDKDGIANLLQKLDNTPDWHAPKQPTIIVGYTAQLAKAIVPSSDGTPYLNGRQVNFINNDRLVLNINSLNEKDGRKLNTETFTASNISFLPAASKGHAYAFANKFNAQSQIGEQFPQFSRHIINVPAHSIDELHKEVIDQLGNGVRAIVKPKGTGHGDGIRAFDIPEKSNPAQIRKELEESLAEVKGTYGDRGGLPYTLSEYLTAARIDKPGHPLDTMKFELRIPVQADVSDPDNRQLKASGAIIKIDGDSKLGKGQSGDFSKQFASVSAQVLATGLSADNFMKALSNEQVMDLIGVTEKDLTELAKWATRYVAYTLEHIDEAESIVPKKN